MPMVFVRITRLLGLYRFCIAITLGTFLFRQNNLKFDIAILILGYLLAVLAFVLLQSDNARNSGAYLFACLIADVVFLLVAIDRAQELLYITLILPILLAHGWMLRSRVAMGHAAMVSLGLLIYGLAAQHGVHSEQLGLLSLAFFMMSGVGLIIGRSTGDTEALAVAQAAEIDQLASLNELIINDMQDGVLVVDRDGFVVSINPQSEKLLLDGQSMKATLTPMQRIPIADLSPPLHRRWLSWRNGETLSETGNFANISGKKRLSARLMSTDLRRRGDIIIFIEDLERAQTQALQLKLGALGRLTASIAHEIRNPLSAIKQSAQLLFEDNEHSPANQRLLTLIDKNSSRIDRIITSVMSLSKRDKTKIRPIEALPFVTNLCAELPITHAIPVEAIHIDCDAKHLVRCDVGHLEEVFFNLLSNAWRYASRKRGCITIRSQLHHAHCTIDVIDDGTGVAANLLEALFEPFHSGSNSAGLGLYLSRELMQANGGNLDNIKTERGACFRITLLAHQS
jgi:two-component system, NtrC family, sensor histidine kinase PilS